MIGGARSFQEYQTMIVIFLCLDANQNKKNEIFYKEKENSFKAQTKIALEDVSNTFKIDVRLLLKIAVVNGKDKKY